MSKQSRYVVFVPGCFSPDFLIAKMSGQSKILHFAAEGRKQVSALAKQRLGQCSLRGVRILKHCEHRPTQGGNGQPATANNSQKGSRGQPCPQVTTASNSQAQPYPDKWRVIFACQNLWFYIHHGRWRGSCATQHKQNERFTRRNTFCRNKAGVQFLCPDV